MSDYAVGIDLGGTNLKACLVRRGEGLCHSDRLPTGAEDGPDRVIERMATLAQAMIDRAPNQEVMGIGIGAPGAINWERTTVTRPPNFPGWDVIDVRARIQGALGQTLPVILENDANVAALGSAFFSVGKPYDDFIMVTLGTGVGGAIIYRNKIFRGSTGGAAEIGHMTIDYEGPFARSGVAGAIEGYLGQQFLSRHARYRLLTRKESLIHEMADEDLSNITPRMLFDAAEAGDEEAAEVLAWAGHKLGCVLGSAICLLDIRTIVVGGGVSAAGRYILEPARKTLPRFVVPSLQENLRILREERGNEVGLLGAAQLVFQDENLP